MYDAEDSRALGELLRSADDQSLREIHLDQAQLIEHFMALDEFRDGLDSHGVALVIDGLDFLAGRKTAVDVLHDAVGELHEIAPDHLEELERARAAVEAGESEAAAEGLEPRRG